MTIKEVFESVNSILPESNLEISADLMVNDTDDIVYRIIFTTTEAAFILFSFQVYLSKNKLKENVNERYPESKLPVEIDNIQEFVTRRNIALLPYLKEYNKDYTNYEKLAELYNDSRGAIRLKKFGV